MGPGFEYFIIFAEMRTGSNFLEVSLNDYEGLQCHGELFNPHFLGGPKKSKKFGISMRDREENPSVLIEKIKSFDDGLHGFRFFHDHDPRILQMCLQDPKCAKIILTRNPVESYISREIVRETKQWRLGDLKQARTSKATFAFDEFSAHLDRHHSFQLELLKGLQVSGQTAFYMAYEDIRDVDVVNGLARFLKVKDKKAKSGTKTKKQNPEPLSEKVTNFAEMESALSSMDYFSLNKAPSFEPRRGASVPKYFAAPKTPIIFLPISSSPSANIVDWLAKLDDVRTEDLVTGLSQKTLRQLKRKFGDHRTFTVLRHPVLRLHEAFVRHILLQGPDCYDAIRQLLRDVYNLPIPKEDPKEDYKQDAHRQAFIAFAKFVKGNLNGQTGVRVDAAWASQAETLRGFSQFMVPDFVFRENQLESDLENLAQIFGTKSPKLKAEASVSPIGLAEIYDESVEAAVKSAYQRDYMMFGFGAWSP
ncbi:MAG: sulfotransferase family 2 domain-containing protein [Paracoccaceae bacterium]